MWIVSRSWWPWQTHRAAQEGGGVESPGLLQHHRPPRVLAPFSTSFSQHIIAGETGSCREGSSITQLCLCAHSFSTVWAQQREGKKPQIPPKSASSAFSAIPLTAKHPARAAAAHQPVSLCCFTREKYTGLKKKKITCCKHVVGQVANNLLEHGSHHKIGFYIVCRGPKFATTLLMATNKCTAV